MGRSRVSREVSLFPARESLRTGEASLATSEGSAVWPPGYSMEVLPNSGGELGQSELLHLHTELQSVSLRRYKGVTFIRGTQCQGAI